MQSITCRRLTVKKNNHVLWHLFFTASSHNSVTHKCLRSRDHINSVNDQYHHVLLQCSACVCLGTSMSSRLFLLILLPWELSCECDGPKCPHLSLLWEGTEEQWHWRLHKETHASGTYHILATVLWVGNTESENGRLFRSLKHQQW